MTMTIFFYYEKVPFPPRCKFLDMPLNCYSNSCRITRIPGTYQGSRHTPEFQAHTRMPGTHQESRHTPGFQAHTRFQAHIRFQAHTRIPDTHQDSRHTSGFRAHTRISGTYQDSRHKPGFRAHTKIPGHTRISGTCCLRRCHLSENSSALIFCIHLQGPKDQDTSLWSVDDSAAPPTLPRSHPQ